MNKKLLAAALGIALTGPMATAMADVTLYGNINVSVDATDTDGGDDDVNMESNTSAIGVKGSEDLGNGYKAVFKAEWQIEADEREKGGMTDRDQYVGLKGGFGQVRFGTISTSYKSHGAKVDPIYRTSLQGRDHGLQSALHTGAGTSGREGRMTNHIRYDTPSFSGFSGTVDYSLDEDDSAASGDDNAWGVGGQYKNGPALVFADYVTSDRGGDDSAWKVGGTWDFGSIDLYGQYEVDDGLLSSSGFSNTSDGADVWMIGGSLVLGNTLVYLGYGQGDDVDMGGGGSAGEYTAWTLAADHHLSKRTDVYAGFNQVDCDEGGTPSRTACASAGPSGGEIDTFSVGLRHKF